MIVTTDVVLTGLLNSMPLQKKSNICRILQLFTYLLTYVRKRKSRILTTSVNQTYFQLDEIYKLHHDGKIDNKSLALLAGYFFNQIF